MFHTLRLDEVKSTVIMHSRKNFLKETIRLIEDLSEKDKGEYRYCFVGTGFGFRCERQHGTLIIFLLVDGKWGPTQGVESRQTIQVGRITVNEWVGGDHISFKGSE